MEEKGEGMERKNNWKGGGKNNVRVKGRKREKWEACMAEGRERGAKKV